MAMTADWLRLTDPAEFTQDMLQDYLTALGRMGADSNVQAMLERGFYDAPSIVRAMFESTAIQASDLQQQFTRVARAAHPDLALDELAIIMHGSDRGVQVKLGRKATINLRVGTVAVPAAAIAIDETMRVATSPEDGSSQVFFKPVTGTAEVVDPHTVVDADGNYTVVVAFEAVEVGEGGNQAAADIDTITVGGTLNLVKPTGDLADGYSQGGERPETIEEYRQRIVLWDQVSGMDTASWYEYLARSVDGIGLARCVPLTRGVGSADIVVAKSYGATSDAVAVAEAGVLVVADRIACQDIRVVAAEEKEVLIKAHLLLEGLVGQVQVESTIRADLTEYVNQDLGPGDSIYTEKLSTIIDTAFTNEIVDHFVETPAQNDIVTQNTLPVLKDPSVSIELVIHATQAQLDTARDAVLAVWPLPEA